MEKVDTKMPDLRFSEFEKPWNLIKIGDVTKVHAGGTPSTLKAEYWGGQIKWMNSGELNLKKVYDVENRITELGLKNSSTKLIPKNCVLIGLAGQGKTRGTVAMNLINLCTNQSIAAIFPNPNLFVENFLYLNLDSRYNELRKLSTGEGGRGGLNLQIIKSLKVFFPSIPEQQKIASFLTAVDDKIQQLTKKKKLLEQYKKGVMQKIFKQKIRFKDDDGNDFPVWEKVELGDILNYEQPTKYLVSNTEYDHSYETPVLTAGKTFVLGYTNEKEGFFKDNLPTIIFDDFTTAFKYVDFTFKAKSSAMKMLIPKKEAVNMKFVYEVMKTLKFPLGEHKRYWISEFQYLKIKYPNTEEQQKIADFLTAIDQKIELVNTQMKKTQVFKKGLLQQMFI